MVEIAGVYCSGLELTCILYDANFTVSTDTLVENGKLGKATYALGTQVNEGDFVALHVDTANTYSNTGGIPVVKAADATDGHIGIVKSQPVFHKIPSSTQSSWNAARLTNGYYRVATVIFPALNMAYKAQSKGDGTAIEVGAPLRWDMSEDAYVDYGTTMGGLFSFHYNNADDTNILVGTGMWAGASGNTDCAGFDAQA